MKKYVGSFPFFFAAVCLSFTNRGRSSEGTNCAQELVWFKVKQFTYKTCSQIFQSDLEEVPDVNWNGLPDELPITIYIYLIRMAVQIKKDLPVL